MNPPSLFQRSAKHANTNLRHLEKTSVFTCCFKNLKANLSSHIILIRLIESANVQLITINGLAIVNEDNERGFNYKDVYEILTRSSPLNLSKFEFVFEERLMPNLKFLESFLNNWKDRQPILLQISLNCINKNQSDMKRLKLLILKYKREGIIKKIDFKFA
ncbi:hypothetical protein GLOIN_2v1671856 [Rhizophagus irregularis DAOM 181602=DAOM 197198]|nr:hypothetical protein GLOIN_2v1671856 [Rhizophagus irregularis DAOM 181602=DAOM 197198]